MAVRLSTPHGHRLCPLRATPSHVRPNSGVKKTLAADLEPDPVYRYADTAFVGTRHLEHGHGQCHRDRIALLYRSRSSNTVFAAAARRLQWPRQYQRKPEVVDR